MLIWLLTHIPESPSIALFSDAATQRGHTVRVVHPASLWYEIGSPDAPPWGSTKRPDVVYTRLGSSAPPGALDALRELEHRGVPTVNGSAALARTRDKILTLQALAEQDVPIPRSVVLAPDSSPEEAAAAIGAPPWILKQPIGTRGIGVVLIDSMTSLRGIVDMLHARGDRLLLQRYVREAEGVDLRVIVVGGRAVAAMRRRAAADDIRANLHRGGSAAAHELDAALAGLAERAAEAVGAEIAGIDVLPAGDGYQVIEVNGSPGLAGIASVCSASFVEAIVRHLERRAGRETG